MTVRSTYGADTTMDMMNDRACSVRPTAFPGRCSRPSEDHSLEPDSTSGPSSYTISILSPDLTYTHPCRYNGSPNSTPALHRPELHEACGMQQQSDHTSICTIHPIVKLDTLTFFHHASLRCSIPPISERTGPAVTMDTCTLRQ